MKFILPILTIFFIFVLNFSSLVKSDKILAVAFISSKSHKIVYQPLLHELGRRGHEVTVLTPIPAGKPIQNVREILTIDFETKMKDDPNIPNVFKMKESGQAFNPFLMFDLFARLCNETYDLDHVKALMKEKFDLIIVQPLFNDCAMGFIHHFNTSLMFISPGPVPPLFSTFTGLPSLPSFVPNLFMPFTDSMSYKERMINFAANVMLTGLQEFYWKPKSTEIYRQKLGNPNLPGVNEVLSNVSLILSNSHVSLSKPKPFMVDIVEVGGMHCHPAKPLPKDLEDFLNSSGEDGFIYFSLGSATPAHTMPEKLRKTFVNVFSKLKQKVLWKWETEEMPDLPKNVKLGKWLPQQDILGHPKIRMFITHGGFGGTTEAVYHGVPLLGIPMFGDQDLNMQQSEKSGYAVKLDFDKLSEEVLTTGINRILEDKKFQERAKYLSKIFQDQIDKPLDRAVFWTEFILRHKGAVHMRSAGRDLNFLQYHSLDIIASYLILIFLIFYIIFVCLRFIWRKLCPSSRKVNTNARSKKTN